MRFVVKPSARTFVGCELP